MLHNGNTVRAWIAISLWIVAIALPGCCRLNLPAIDPTGQRIFLPRPNGTSLLTPRSANIAGPNLPAAPVVPAFTRAPDPASCCGNQPNTRRRHGDKQYLIPNTSRNPSRGQLGEIILTPSRIIAPVGSEVVVLAGICGNDYHYVMNQPLEWTLSGDSVGQLVEVGGLEHSRFNKLIPPSAKKFDGNYAWGRTGLKNRLLTRGTPTPVDDIQLGKGQAYVSVSSASQGTSYITCVAPKAQAWDKRRKSTIIHWVDAMWSIPVPKSATAGTVTPLTTLVTKNTDSGGVPGYKVKYTIIGGAPAEFAPNGSQAVEVLTNDQGQATVQLRQAAGQFEPGTTQIRVDVIRPALFGQGELQVESGITSVDWSAPALSIRAIGPQSAGINEAFNYRVEVTNPGDQLTRGVVLRTKDLPDGLEFVSSSPKPSVFGRQLEWQLGDISPGSQPSIVDVQLKSNQRGNNELCFEVSSQEDQLQTEACAQTEISAPCIGLQVEGPNAGKVGDQASFDIIIANQCEEPLENLQLEIQYDAGLSAGGDLGNPIRAEVGTIQPGQRKSMPITFNIVAPGRHCYNLSVTADGGHVARATECVEAAPSASTTIDLELTGQRRIERGDRVLIRGTATNTGNIALNNVTMTNRFSDSLEPRRVSELFPHRWLGNEADELLFELGTLNPGESKPVEIIYDGLQVDGDAFSEMTISSTDLEPQTQRYDLRIEPTGSLGGASGSDSGSASDLEPRNPGGFQPEPTPDVRPNEGPIQIPNDPGVRDLNAQRNLVATARTLDRQINVGGQTRVQFEVENQSSVADQDVNVSLLIPPSLQLGNVFDDAGNQIEIVSRSRDFTRFDLEPRREMRAGDKVIYIVNLIGVQPGNPFVEVQAFSANTAGSVTASDSITINP